ncbi:MAG: Pr6Pr family membrane protein [Thermomicrobiales bacterium]
MIPAGPLPLWVRGYRLVFGVLDIVAMGWQFFHGSHGDPFKQANFFSFFTIQSNIIAAVVLLIGASGLPFVARPTRQWDLVRGAAAIYLTLTFIVFALLLSTITEELQTTIPWVNDVVHRIVPLVLIADFLLVPLSRRITFRQSLVWMIYPLLWLGYTLVRAQIVDWYPYPFLDPAQSGGWPGVTAACVAILLGFVAVCWVMTCIGGILTDRTTERGTTA